jgi:hypothetical protein
MTEPHLQLADVLHAGFSDYCREHGPQAPQVYTVANAIMACRTAALGGQVMRCDHCDHRHIVYHSCGNRHCPTCQALARSQWVAARCRELLPVPYFHVVFTIPSQLNAFALRNKKVFYDLLFAAASQTLLDLAQDQKRLGAQIGAIMVLHTWGQALMDHPHLHCIVPSGGLEDDRWVTSKNPRFLFPVKVMATLFRGKFLDAFRKAIADRQIRFHGLLQAFERDPATLGTLIDTLYKTDWLVYAKPPFGGPRAVVKYLGRYTHRIAISNSRLIGLTGTHVRFQWKDYADNNKSKIMTLEIGEFIRRFLLHVLPPGFVRIRYYGFLSCRSRMQKLQLCRDQIDPEKATGEMGEEMNEEKEISQTAEKQPFRCPLCREGRLHWLMDLPGSRRRNHDADARVHDPGGEAAVAA